VPAPLFLLLLKNSTWRQYIVLAYCLLIMYAAYVVLILLARMIARE
jgi:hypothetical protein